MEYKKNENKKVEYKKKYSSNKPQKNVTAKVGLIAKSAENKSEDISEDKLENKSKNIVITDWFFMTPSEVTAKMISDLVKLQSNVQVDLWEEMNILQLEMSNKTTVDFEPTDINFKDPSDISFIKNRNIRTIFTVTIEDGALEELKVILKLFIAEWDGFLCADSDDFKPQYGNE